MKPPPFSYHDPRTIADAVGLLGRLENAKLLAGGQSLMPMLNMRFVLPDHVIDLNRVDGLSYIREQQRRARDRRHDAPARPRILRRRAPALPADARGDPAGRPPPDPQSRHARRLAVPSRSIGGTCLGCRRRRRQGESRRPQRRAHHRLRRISGRLHDAGAGARRTAHRRKLSRPGPPATATPSSNLRAGTAISPSSRPRL